MMLSILAALAAQSVATPDRLSNLFLSGCLDGSVRISPGDAAPIQFSELPRALRNRLGDPSSARVWKMRSGDRSYFYVLDYRGRSSTRICGVAGEDLPLVTGTSAMHARLRGGQSVTTYGQSTEWFFPNTYKALATRTGGYTVLQVNWLTENQAGISQTQ